MLLTEAIKLIDNKEINNDQAEHWADFGCGTGLFTKALASIIKTGSTITAIDKNSDSLKKLNGVFNGVTIETLQEDFTTAKFSAPLNGILMANALHYVADQQNFAGHLKTLLKEKGSIVIVEYDTDKSNPWVPYPVNYNKLVLLFQQQDFLSIELIGRQSSVYGAEMYSVIIKN
ncbi:class I SAM-dependent methyltransferase [Ferruginibacter sp. SUN106]|uniref:class I SAM-dependent methyltransferase n=1 Tax=Ferruginibacter sp. SUN106 TaxID=2978348 RepID=UPI003D36EB8F